MLIKVKKKITVDDVVEIEFPLFAHDSDMYDSGGGYDTYFRIDEDGSYWMLTRQHTRGEETFDYRFDNGKINIEHDIGKYLTYFKSDAKEFAKVLQKFKTKLSAFPGVQA